MNVWCDDARGNRLPDNGDVDRRCTKTAVTKILPETLVELQKYLAVDVRICGRISSRVHIVPLRTLFKMPKPIALMALILGCGNGGVNKTLPTPFHAPTAGALLAACLHTSRRMV